MKKTMSMKDISIEAGVSIATVSRVINKQGNYSPEIEKRVLDVIQRNNYVPNLAAQALRSSRMPFIGIMLTEIVNQHFSEIVYNLQMRLFEMGYVTVICNTSDKNRFMNRYIDMFSTYNFCGILYIATVFYEDTVIPTDIPSVFIECNAANFPPKSPHVVIQTDHVQAGYDSTRYLLERGCSRILFLRSEHGLQRQSGKFIGYQHALWEHHISPEDDWLITIDYSSAKSAYQRLMQYIDSNKPFDGVLCNSDTAATGVIRVLKDRGINVPGDVKVLGYTNSDISKYYYPQISSVDMNVEAIVDIAAECMLQLIRGEAIRQPEYTLPAKLCIRETT